MHISGCKCWPKSPRRGVARGLPRCSVPGGSEPQMQPDSQSLLTGTRFSQAGCNSWSVSKQSRTRYLQLWRSCVPGNSMFVHTGQKSPTSPYKKRSEAPPGRIVMGLFSPRRLQAQEREGPSLRIATPQSPTDWIPIPVLQTTRHHPAKRYTLRNASRGGPLC